jgi:hypothetical protein
MFTSHKNKMAAYYVNSKKCFRRHIGFSRHFEFLAWQLCFYLNFQEKVFPKKIFFYPKYKKKQKKNGQKYYWVKNINIFDTILCIAAILIF